MFNIFKKEQDSTTLGGRLGRGLLALTVATAIWIPSLHLLFTRKLEAFRSSSGLSPQAEQLAARHLQLWTEPKLREQELGRMRASNAEWDFMGRTFLVWSLAEMGLRHPEAKQDYLKVMDQIIDETLRLEQEHGIYFFLMPYAKSGSFVMQPPHSMFLDSEIAMMLAARRMLEEKPAYRPLLKERVDLMVARMEQSPLLSAESYPDECWTFDNAAAVAAMRMEDRLDGTDHSAFIRRWLAMTRAKLIDPKTGILIAAFQVDGTPLYGPEGSSIWMLTHLLRLADENFAQDQYRRAKKELSREMAGFAWSREWPATWRGDEDVDSGPVIPGFDISAGASGMAVIGASSFEDGEYLTGLAATLDFAAFPSRQAGRLKYCASNQVGDAALLYATVLGPLWDKTEGVKR